MVPTKGTRVDYGASVGGKDMRTGAMGGGPAVPNARAQKSVRGASSNAMTSKFSASEKVARPTTGTK